MLQKYLAVGVGILPMSDTALTRLAVHRSGSQSQLYLRVDRRFKKLLLQYRRCFGIHLADIEVLRLDLVVCWYPTAEARVSRERAIESCGDLRRQMSFDIQSNH